MPCKIIFWRMSVIKNFDGYRLHFCQIRFFFFKSTFDILVGAFFNVGLYTIVFLKLTSYGAVNRACRKGAGGDAGMPGAAPLPATPSPPRPLRRSKRLQQKNSSHCNFHIVPEPTRKEETSLGQSMWCCEDKGHTISRLCVCVCSFKPLKLLRNNRDKCCKSYVTGVDL